MLKNKSEIEARKKILEMVKDYCDKYHLANEYGQNGEDRICYASRVYDSEEMINLVDSSLDFWLTSGRYTEEFEREFARFLDVKYCSVVNSGSSANLIAFMTLTSPLLGKRMICRGDEIITVAAGFPTTVAPIIQYGAVPVFVDVTIPQYNIDVEKLEEAVSPKTKAVMIAHTMGNPFNLEVVKHFCEKYELWLIEDNCDALGSEYSINGDVRLTGTLGDIGTSSFYPPHHITMGEGGAVYTNNVLLHKIIRSLRDWGRECMCPPGKDNICKHRFDRIYGELPFGYDHKYVYSHFGYNLKVTDMQAAIGCAQLKKIPIFIRKRQENFKRLIEKLRCIEDKIILPEACENSNPSWFGFLMTCRNEIDRNQVIRYIENKGIQTRMLFAGNLLRQPCFKTHENYRIVGKLEITDIIMEKSFWVGIYPGMTDEKLDYIANTIINAVSK